MATRQRGSRFALWTFAIVMVIAGTRYFYLSPPTVNGLEDRGNAAIAKALGSPVLPSIHPFDHHPVLLSVHIAASSVAMLIGLFQFLPKLRNSRPQLHRKMGYFYFAGVTIGSATGLPMSFMFFDPLPAALRSRLMPVSIGFAVLSVAWLFTTGMALYHARNHRFAVHRAWMIRSYCLTYAAVTTRLLAPVFLLLSRDPILSVNLSLLSWPLNLVFAEWLIRRGGREPQLFKAAAGSV